MRSVYALLIAGCGFYGATCQQQLPIGGTGRVVVSVTGLAPGATDWGMVTVAVQDNSIAPIAAAVPPGGGDVEVPVGAYSLTYTPPPGYTLSVGEVSPKDVSVLDGQSTAISFTVEPVAGTLAVQVSGLGPSAVSGGSATILRTDVPSTPITVSIPASGAATAAVPSGNYRVTYATPNGYALSAGQAVYQDVVVASSGTTVVTFLVVPVTQPPVTFYPNEPPSFVTITERSFDNTNPADASLWTLDPPGTEFSYQADNAAPRSPPGVGQTFFAENMASGSPITLKRPFGVPPQRDSLYVAFWFRLSPNWNASNNNQTRLLDVQGASTSSTQPKVHLLIGGPGAGPYTAELFVSAPVSRSLTANRSSVALQRGQWYRWEVIVVMNSSGGNSTGQARWWIDDSLVGEYTDLNYFASGAVSGGWIELLWRPDYDGTTATGGQWQRIDHIRVSGR